MVGNCDNLMMMEHVSILQTYNSASCFVFFFWVPNFIVCIYFFSADINALILWRVAHFYKFLLPFDSGAQQQSNNAGWP